MPEGTSGGYLVELAEQLAQVALRYKLQSITLGELQIVTTPLTFAPAPAKTVAQSEADLAPPKRPVRDEAPPLDPSIFKASG